MKTLRLSRSINLTRGTFTLWLKALINIDLKYESRWVLRDSLCGIVGDFAINQCEYSRDIAIQIRRHDICEDISRLLDPWIFPKTQSAFNVELGARDLFGGRPPGPTVWDEIEI
jgi:hypothetical protein